jgi:hypothetical protein
VNVAGATVSLAFKVRDWRLGLSIETAAPYRLRMSHAEGEQPAYWAMDSNDSYLESVDHFTELRGAALQEFVRARQVTPHGARLTARVVDAFSDFARTALATCAARPRRLALPLDFRLRFNAYQLLCDDHSGRLAQLRAVCPGAFVLLAALCRSRSRARRSLHLGQHLRRNIVAGRKLNHALREVLLGADSLEGCVLKTWRPDLWRARADTRVLDTWLPHIRRAPVAVDALSLLLPPPLGTALDDMPSGATAKMHWYDGLAWLNSALSSRPPHPSHVRVGEFMSRHGVAVRRWLCRQKHDLFDFVAFIETSGRAVGRSVDPEKALQDFARHDSLPFPAAPLAPLDRTGAHLKHVPDRPGLVRQGRVFRNCARQLTRKVSAGKCAIYVGSILGTRLMVQVNRSEEGQWRRGEVRRVANELPSDDELAVVDEWVAECLEGATPHPGQG